MTIAIDEVGANTAPERAAAYADRFGHFARVASTLSGKPLTFLTALVVVIAWAVTGPIFHYSDTWQLVINTGTTIVTFLMVFLIQNTQNRDQMAMQIKLAELIVALKGAQNRMAVAEELSDEELEALHQEYRQRCEETADSLSRRRGVGKRPDACGPDTRESEREEIGSERTAKLARA